MSGDQINMLEQSIIDLMVQIRPDAVALVDAFDIPDFCLRSSLGRYDGNVYESLMEFAKKSSLNKSQVR